MTADRFGPAAADYAANRPTYPQALYDWLAAQCVRRSLAWDCGAGSGQATTAIAALFERVIATDISAQQVSRAGPLPNVAWRIASAEDSGIEAATVDLVAVAQALHWFDLDRFHAEARRVLVPGGVIAAWTYGVPVLSDAAIDAAFRDFHDRIVGPYWPAERHLVGAGYLALPFPFARIAPPAFTMRSDWPLSRLVGYLRSWSATTACLRAHGEDPVAAFAPRLAAAWGDPRRLVTLDWPLTVLAGRK